MLLALVLGLAAQTGPEKPSSPPVVGQIAPELGYVEWMQLEGKALPARTLTGPTLRGMRGKVVVLQSYGYYCDSCVRVGVPMAVGLYRANRELGLEVISLTGTWGEDGDRELLPEAKKLGIEHAIGMADYYGAWSPYLDLSRHPLTHAYVITRTGGILWAGDPSSKPEEFLEAVDMALQLPAAEPLPESLHADLAEAIELYVRGEMQKSLERAESIREKHARRSGEESAAIAADAGMLVAWIESSRRALVDAAGTAETAPDPESLVRAVRGLSISFSKSREAQDARARLEAARKDSARAPVLKQWEEWLALESERPPLFPAVAGADERKFARAVERFLDSRDEAAPGVATARRWVERFAALPAER